MVTNLVLTSWRSFKKNQSSTFINFAGLIFGFTGMLITGLYLHHELTYDQYHENGNHIYRITHNEKAGEIPGIRHLATVGPPVGPALKQTFTQVENSVRFRYSPDRIMRVNDRQHYEGRVYFVDPSVFDVFSFALQKGDKATALSLPNNIVITSEMAIKYFGYEDPLGKTIIMDNSIPMMVTGVLASLPSNTHLKFDSLIPFEAFKVPYGFTVNLTSWGWISFHTYVLLKPETNVPAFERQLDVFVKSHWSEDQAKKFKVQLQPLSDIYLGEVIHEAVDSGNYSYIVVLVISGCLIVLIAGFNFANLYTAFSLTRAKEIGVRQVVGGARNFTVQYLFIEAIGISIVTALMSILLLPFVVTYLNSLGFHLDVNGFFLTQLAFCAIGLAGVMGLLAAFYPASLLSSLSYHQLLKGSFRTSQLGNLVRRSLVMVQFCFTIALISSLLIIERQMEYIYKKDLGYAKDELVLLQMPGENLARIFPTLHAQLILNPHVVDVSLGGGRMDGDSGNVPIYAEANLDEGIPMAIGSATFDFFKTIGVTLIAGREISVEFQADTARGVLINESAMKTFGWTPEEALGKNIRIGDFILDGEIIGIIPDFNFGLLRSSIKPLVMYYPRTRLQDIYVRFRAGTDAKTLITSLQHNWNIVAPEYPFDAVFLNEYLNSLYRSEKFLFLLFKVFAFAAIFISCLGLFALVSQDVLFREKEIGIRKSLGASSIQILLLIVRPLLLLIMLAGSVATPISWWGMRSWLAEFSFHISINWAVFAWAIFGTLSIAFLTVSYKTIQASRTNPVKSLRSE